MFKLLFSRKGRISRKEFVIGFFTPFFLALFLGTTLILFGFQEESQEFILANGIFRLAFVYSFCCIVIKRFQDLGDPPIHSCLMIVPFVNIYFAFELFFKKGNIGLNQYGQDPLAIEKSKKFYEAA